jgi:hypothetical protein
LVLPSQSSSASPTPWTRAGRRESSWPSRDPRRIGDRLTDETGEWEIIGRPYASAAGKIASARVRKIGQVDVTEIRTWGAHERIAVRRATAEEGKR